MKIAISANGSESTAELDSRFGRCAYFVIYDSEEKKYSSIINPAADAAGGAGPAAVAVVAKNNVGVVLTGHLGAKAEQALYAAQIKFCIDYSGIVEDVVSSYLDTC